MSGISLVPSDKLEAKIVFRDPSKANRSPSIERHNSLHVNDTLEEVGVEIGDLTANMNTRVPVEEDVESYSSWET